MLNDIQTQNICLLHTLPFPSWFLIEIERAGRMAISLNHVIWQRPVSDLNDASNLSDTIGVQLLWLFIVYFQFNVI